MRRSAGGNESTSWIEGPTLTDMIEIDPARLDRNVGERKKFSPQAEPGGTSWPGDIAPGGEGGATHEPL